jgi:uncharacterized protein
MLELGFGGIKGKPSRTKEVCFTVSKTSEMYDAFGNIYDCSETSYVPAYDNSDYKVGNLGKDHKNVNLKRSILNDWNDTLLTDQFPCHSCKMLPVCGGGCPKSWHEDMRACPTAKFNIKDQVLLNYLQVRIRQNDSPKIQELVNLYPDKKWLQSLKSKFSDTLAEV